MARCLVGPSQRNAKVEIPSQAQRIQGGPPGHPHRSYRKFLDLELDHHRLNPAEGCDSATEDIETGVPGWNIDSIKFEDDTLAQVRSLTQIRIHSPLENFKVFWRIPELLKIGGGPGGSGGSEKHIWKIFYRGDPEIETPGTPRGSHGAKKIL